MLKFGVVFAIGKHPGVASYTGLCHAPWKSVKYLLLLSALFRVRVLL